MRKLQEIEDQIMTLTQTEFDQLREWFLERDGEAWDKQFESDIADGRLDALGDAARRAYECGRSTMIR